jgi:hypothetical protein
MGPTSLHLGSTMTMAARAKLFVNVSSTGHQAISDERRMRENVSWRWIPAIGGDTTPPLFEGRWERYGDHHKKE